MASLRIAWVTLNVAPAATADVPATGGIPCDVLAGYSHDHLLVPPERVDEAVESLESLAD